MKDAPRMTGAVGLLGETESGQRDRRRRRRSRTHAAPSRHGRDTQRWMAAAIGAGIPSYLALEQGGLDPVVWQQAAVFVWWGIALAFAFGILPAARVPPRIRLVFLALAALIAWTTLALLWTESAERTWSEIARIVAYAGLLVLALSSLHRDTWRWAAAGISAAIIALPVLALSGRLFPEVFPADSLVHRLDGERLAYPLGYWNAVACWCAAAIAVGVTWSAHSRTWVRWAALAAVPVAGVALYLTYSRGGVVSAVVGIAAGLLLARNRLTFAIHGAAAGAAIGIAILVVRSQEAIADGTSSDGALTVGVAVLLLAGACALLAASTRRSQVDRRRLPLAPVRGATLAIVAAVVAVAVIAGPSVVSREEEGLGGEGYPAEGSDPAGRLVSLGTNRHDVWTSSLGAFGSAPLTGIGPGTFEFWWTRDGREETRLRDAHSMYLETLAELGLVGFVLLVALIVALLSSGVRTWASAKRTRDAAAAAAMLAAGSVFIVQAGVDWMWESPAIVAIGLGSLGVVAAGRSRSRGRSRRLTPRRAAWVGVAVLAGAIQVPSVVSLEALRSSESYLAAGLETRAAERADDAVTAEPWAANPRAQRAFVALADGRTPLALDEVGAAIDREPTNWRHRYLQMQISIAARDRDAALDAFDELVRLRPAFGKDVDGIRREIERRVRRG